MNINFKIEDLEQLLSEAVQRGIILEEERVSKHFHKKGKFKDIITIRGFRWNTLITDNHSKQAKKEAKNMLAQIEKTMKPI